MLLWAGNKCAAKPEALANMCSKKEKGMFTQSRYVKGTEEGFLFGIKKPHFLGTCGLRFYQRFPGRLYFCIYLFLHFIEFLKKIYLIPSCFFYPFLKGHLEFIPVNEKTLKDCWNHQKEEEERMFLIYISCLIRSS